MLKQVYNFLRISSVLVIVGIVSSLLVVANGANASGVNYHVDSHSGWPIHVSVNPVCFSKDNETGCVEATPTGLKLTSAGYPPSIYNSNETLNVVGLTSAGKQAVSYHVYYFRLQPVPEATYFRSLRGPLEYLGGFSVGAEGVSFNLVVGPETDYIINQSIPATQVNAADFSVHFKATGGGLIWNPIRNVPGLTMNSSTGVLSGTPKKAGTFSVSVSVTNQYKLTARKNLLLVVH